MYNQSTTLHRRENQVLAVFLLVLSVDKPKRAPVSLHFPWCKVSTLVHHFCCVSWRIAALVLPGLTMLFLLCCGFRLCPSGRDLTQYEHSCRTVSASQITSRQMLSAPRFQCSTQRFCNAKFQTKSQDIGENIMDPIGFTSTRRKRSLWFPRHRSKRRSLSWDV